MPTLPKSADVNAWATQPIPQTPNTLPGCIAGDPTSGVGANECYDQPLKNGGGRLTTNPIRWTGITAPDGKAYNICSHFCPYDTNQYVTQPFESMDWPVRARKQPVGRRSSSPGGVMQNRTYGKEQVPAASSGRRFRRRNRLRDPLGRRLVDRSAQPERLRQLLGTRHVDGLPDVSGGKFAWHLEIWEAPCCCASSGTVDTASGLTFVGHVGPGNGQTGLGYLAAVNTKTGSGAVGSHRRGR